MSFPFRCPHCDIGYQVKDELAGKHTKCKKCGKVMLLNPPKTETTSGGSVVYRHALREREIEPVGGDIELIGAVEKHIERYVGKYDMVFHEIVSDMVHVDVHWVSPTPLRNWHTLVTSGMSERPMHVPTGSGLCEYAEMVVCLPQNWKVSQEAFKINEEQYYWPIRWLKTLARLPHEYETFLAPGHTVPNGDPPQPFHPTTKTCCWVVLSPIWFDEKFAQLDLPDGRSISFLAMLPIFSEEMRIKLNKGLDELTNKLGSLPPTELMNPSRKNTAARRFGIF